MSILAVSGCFSRGGANPDSYRECPENTRRVRMARQPRFAKFALAATVALSLFATARAEDHTVGANTSLTENTDWSSYD